MLAPLHTHMGNELDSVQAEKLKQADKIFPVTSLLRIQRDRKVMKESWLIFLYECEVELVHFGQINDAEARLRRQQRNVSVDQKKNETEQNISMIVA